MLLLMMYIIAKGGILQLRRLYFLPIQFFHHYLEMIMFVQASLWKHKDIKSDKHRVTYNLCIF